MVKVPLQVNWLRVRIFADVRGLAGLRVCGFAGLWVCGLRQASKTAKKKEQTLRAVAADAEAGGPAKAKKERKAHDPEFVLPEGSGWTQEYATCLAWRLRALGLSLGLAWRVLIQKVK